MAGDKSSEGKVTTLECMVCEYREVFTKRQFQTTDGLRCNRCDSPVQPSITRPGEKVNNRRMKRKKNSFGTITVDVDVSDALTGLKAIQREAKKATAALKELEEQKKEKYLVIELDELGDVPRVIHQGEEITTKEFINFQWTTKSNVPGNTDIIVDYFEQDGKKKSVREGISS